MAVPKAGQFPPHIRVASRGQASKLMSNVSYLRYLPVGKLGTRSTVYKA
jgi:hypothetical protein